MTITVGPIEHGVPLPVPAPSYQRAGYRRWPWPFATMAPGDSFTIFGPRLDLFRIRNLVAVAANKFAATRDWQFATRVVLAEKIGWCVRVWRLR